MKIGYARVSTDDQNLDLQRSALTEAGCAVIHEDKLSGATTDRPGLHAALAGLADGDVFVVWRLDRLGRSLPDLIATLAAVGQRGAGFVSLKEAIDMTTPAGRLVFHMMGAMAEFERDLIRERTRAGLAVARKRGVRLGRPRKLTEFDIGHAKALLDTTGNQRVVAERFNVNRKTLGRALAREKTKAGQ